MGKSVFMTLLYALFALCTTAQTNGIKKVKIEWVDTIKGDFSFTNGWEYPEGVAKKDDGRAGCADGGLCPQECYLLMDSLRNVPDSLLAKFYEYLDTTHYNFSLQCEAKAYEFAGSNYVSATRNNNDSVKVFSWNNIATHSSLELILSNDSCVSLIKLNSIHQQRNNQKESNVLDTIQSINRAMVISKIQYDISPYIAGYIQIDKQEWDSNILKAKFHFTFKNDIEGQDPLWWSGLIYTPIINED